MGTRIVWIDKNLAEEEHRVYRDTAPFDETALPGVYATLAPDVTEYEDLNVTPGTTYYYRVGAVTSSGTVEMVSDLIEVACVPYAGSTSGLIAHWKMDTLVNGLLPDETGSYPLVPVNVLEAPGRFGGGMDFSRYRPSYAYYDGQVAVPGDAFTASLWARVRDINRTGGHWLISHREDQQNNDPGWQIAFRTNDPELAFFVSVSDTETYLLAVPNPDEDTWFHVVARFDNGNMRLYLNGELADEREGPSTVDTSSTVLSLGVLSAYLDQRRPSFPGNEDVPPEDLTLLDGVLDEVRLYNRALSPHEIMQLYAGGL